MTLTRQGEAQEGQFIEMEECMIEQEEKGRTTQLLQRGLKKWILGWQGSSVSGIACCISMTTPVPFPELDGVVERWN